MEMSKAVDWPRQTKAYIEEVRSEMRRVTWPAWKEVRATTGVVIAAVFLFAGYFFVVDVVVRACIDRVIHSFTHAS
jgi:preprotein translocase subunit SecE